MQTRHASRSDPGILGPVHWSFESQQCKIIVKSSPSAKKWMSDNLQDIAAKYSSFTIISPIMVAKDYLNEFVSFSMQTMGGSEDVSGIDQGTPTPRPESEDYFKAIYFKSRTSKKWTEHSMILHVEDQRGLREDPRSTIWMDFWTIFFYDPKKLTSRSF